MTMNPVMHFEMPYENRERVAKFYEETFGWKTQKMGAEMGEYLLAQTDEMDSMGMLKQTNRINGGFYKKMEDPDMNHPSVVIAVEDLSESMKKINEAGGKLIGEAADIPGIGKYISFYDTEGNRVGALQPLNSMN